MSIPYLEKSSSDPSLPMNKRAEEPKPVAWRWREKGKSEWKASASDPTDVLQKYFKAEFEIEPLFTQSTGMREG